MAEEKQSTLKGQGQNEMMGRFYAFKKRQKNNESFRTHLISSIHLVGFPVNIAGKKRHPVQDFLRGAKSEH